MKFLSSNPKTAISVTGAFVLALALAGCSTSPAPTPVASVPDAAPSKTAKPEKTVVDKNPHSITWLTSYDKALQTAKENHQPVMIDFYADWCTACKYLDKNIYTAPDVIKESKKFVNLKINSDKDTDIAARYKIYALPTLIFLDGNGKVLWRLEGAPPTTPFFIQTMQKAQDKFATGV
jgi:thiol:disulfide interchange protein